MIHADTEGLLDRCHCGAVAGFETGKDPDTGEVSERARCTECCEQTRWSETRGEAMADWNWNMRRLSNNCFNLTPTASVKQMLDSSQKGKRGNDMVTSASTKRHASWKDYRHVGQCYGVRNRRRGKTAYSRDGVTWFDSYGTEMDRPAGNIMFHGGFLEGKTQIG